MALFTVESSKIAAQLSAEARRAKRDARWAAMNATLCEQSADEYLIRRIARVRKQQDRIDEMLLTERDPSKLDRLVSAAARLSEVERKLSMRPDPGTAKPTRNSTSRGRQTLSVSPQPAKPTPQPVANCVPPEAPKE